MMRILVALMVFLVMGAGTASAGIFQDTKRVDGKIYQAAKGFEVEVKDVAAIAACATLVKGGVCGDFETSVPNAPVNCVGGIDGDVCYHFFEKSKVIVTYKPTTTPEKCQPIRVHVEQLSTRLRTALPEMVHLEEGATTCQAADLSIEIPALEHETEFRVWINKEIFSSGWDAGHEGLQIIPIKAYPRTLTDPVKSWAAFEGNALIVQDKEGRLLDFLDKHEVKYLTRDTMPNAERKLHIVVGQPPEREEMDDIKGDVMYLMEKTDILPVVRIRETPKRMTVKIKTKLLDALAADDPLATKAFVEIFKEIAK